MSEEKKKEILFPNYNIPFSIKPLIYITRIGISM